MWSNRKKAAGLLRFKKFVICIVIVSSFINYFIDWKIKIYTGCKMKITSEIFWVLFGKEVGNKKEFSEKLL